jgi:hypothetical protein
MVLKYRTVIGRYLKKSHPNIYGLCLKILKKIDGHSNQDVEQHMSYGSENIDKTYFIIRCSNHTIGIAAHYNNVLGYTYYALKKGWIPIVDLQNFRSQYLNVNKLGKENAWEYYFVQPCGVDLEFIKKSKNIVLSDVNTHQWAFPRTLGKLLNEESDEEIVGQIYEIASRYLRINQSTLDYCNRIYDSLDMKDKNVLGVHSRGTDMIGTPSHSVQPSLENLLDIVDKKMGAGYDCIFLATEEENVVEAFKKRFGNGRVINAPAQRYDIFENGVLNQVIFDRENDEFLRGLEYLSEIYILSKCQALIGTYVGASVAAMVMNGGKYREVEMIDLGVY